MKAIEILNNINVWGDVTEVEEQINEAIVEIEALNNRSCESCMHWHSKREFCTLFDIYSSIGGCGDYWESKC